MAFVAAIPAVTQAAQNKTVWQGVGTAHAEGMSLAKKLILAPIVIVCIILLIAVLIAIANGAYTMGTLVTFIIGAGGLYGVYWFTQADYTAVQYISQNMQDAPQQTQQGPPPNYYAPQPQQYQYGYQPPPPLAGPAAPPAPRMQPQYPARVVRKPVNPSSQFAASRAALASKGIAEGEGEEFVSDEVDVKKDNETHELIE